MRFLIPETTRVRCELVNARRPTRSGGKADSDDAVAGADFERAAPEAAEHDASVHVLDRGRRKHRLRVGHEGEASGLQRILVANDLHAHLLQC